MSAYLTLQVTRQLSFQRWWWEAEEGARARIVNANLFISFSCSLPSFLQLFKHLVSSSFHCFHIFLINEIVFFFLNSALNCDWVGARCSCFDFKTNCLHLCALLVSREGTKIAPADYRTRLSLAIVLCFQQKFSRSGNNKASWLCCDSVVL